MQIDIKCVAAGFNRNDLADGKLTIQHHRAFLNIRQGLCRQAQSGGGHFAEAVFFRLLHIGIQRIAGLYCPFLARDNTNTAFDPLAGAGAQHFDAIKTHFHVKTAVNDKFAVAAHQVAILRGNGHLEGDAFSGQLALQNLTHFHAVQHQRLPGINAVTLRCRERHRRHIRFIEQGFVSRKHHKVISRLPLSGHQFERIPGQQGAEAGVIQRDFRLFHLNKRLISEQGDHAWVNRHLTGHFTAGIEVEFGQLPDFQPLVHQRGGAGFQAFAVRQLQRDQNPALAMSQIFVQTKLIVLLRGLRIGRGVKGNSAIDQRGEAFQLDFRAAEADIGLNA